MTKTGNQISVYEQLSLVEVLSSEQFWWFLAVLNAAWIIPTMIIYLYRNSLSEIKKDIKNAYRRFQMLFI